MIVLQIIIELGDYYKNCISFSAMPKSTKQKWCCSGPIQISNCESAKLAYIVVIHWMEDIGRVKE